MISRWLTWSGLAGSFVPGRELPITPGRVISGSFVSGVPVISKISVRSFNHVFLRQEFSARRPELSREQVFTDKCAIANK